MNNLKTVTLFTIKEIIKRKAFIISNIIILLMIVFAFNIPNIKKAMDSNSDSKIKILIKDKNNIFEDKLALVKNIDNINYDFILDNNISIKDIKKKINNNDIDRAIVFNKKKDNVDMKYIVESLTFVESVPEELVKLFENLYSNIQLNKFNLSKEQLNSLNPNFTFSFLQAEEDEVGGNPFVVMLISMLLFFTIYFNAFQVSTIITTEKTSKIVETLLTSTTPKTIVLGKTFGVGFVGLIQIIMIIITSIISKLLFLPNDSLEGIIDLSNITPFLFIITIVYFLLGYFLFALLYALIGSTVSKPEDVQSANTPISLILIAGFYLSYFTMINPTSEANVLAGILPISSPFCMPFRVMMGIASVNDIIISILLLVVTILIIAKVSIKIYSQAILNYGSRISLKDAIKLFKNKNV